MNFLVMTVMLTLSLSSFGQAGNMDQPLKPSHIEIKKADGNSGFYVNGVPFELKGAGGGGSLVRLHEAGGNSIRTWSANNGKQIIYSPL